MVKSAHLKSADEYFLLLWGTPGRCYWTLNTPEVSQNRSQITLNPMRTGADRVEAIFTINQGSVTGDKSILCISMRSWITNLSYLFI